MKKLKPQMVNFCYIIIVVLAVALAAVGAISNIKTFATVGLILLVADVFFRLVFYRCPYCHRYLGRSAGAYCPYCGKEMNE